MQTIEMMDGGGKCRGLFVIRLFAVSDPCTTVAQFVVEGGDAGRANYLAGVELDRLHDETGIKYDYEVRPSRIIR